MSRVAETGPRVSVIVPARRLDAYGRRCLEHLLHLRMPLEVVLVTDADEGELDPRVVCVVHPGGAAAKRQAGLLRARGGIVALIDDDAYPHPSWLEAALTLLEDDTVGAVCGPSLGAAGDTRLEVLGGRTFASWLVSGPQRWRYVPQAAREVDDAPSVNLVVRRTLALAAGFDTAYHPGEDSIFCDRLVRAGVRIVASPDVIVFHSRRALWLPHARQVWRFGRRRGTFRRRFGGNSGHVSYLAPLGVLALAAAAPRSRPARRATAAYLAVCAAAAFEARPADWARRAAAIPFTHLVYGTGLLVGLLGVPLPEERR